VLKTSSGKIRHAATRERYERGNIGRGEVPVWRQVVRLALAGLSPQSRRLRQATAQVAYAAYMWTLCGILAPCTWMGAVILPVRVWRHLLVGKLLRLGLRLARLPLRIEGLERLPQQEPYVLVVNHASYLDAVVLLATLPNGLTYVAKYELATHCLSRLPMRRLGVEFVERFEAQRGVEDTTRLVKVAQAGERLVFFPEGTFGREPGLRPFHMGAFMIAAQAGVAVVPVSIRGTRSILRANQWFPHWGVIRLTVGTPISPPGTDWASALALRDAARAQILRTCGEPDLEGTSDKKI
jgi:1-acyl-sn-glycerol-3-phosphate acyltransferase